jgi:C-terminal processing protease CtpA/Prc
MRIIALVNSRCGSDCELLTEMLASLRETIVVGTNTYGVCQMIQPGYSVLPHTGLRYRIALGRSDPYGDNRSVDGYGLDVDVVLPDVDTLKPEKMIELAEVVAKQ